MEENYKWPPLILPEVKEKVKQEIGRIIKYDLVRCDCGPLSIRVHTYALDTRFKAQLQCKCGTADQWGILEGKIPATEGNLKKFKERRYGKETRSGLDRRKLNDPNYKGPNTRSGKERRSKKNRRKPGGKDLRPENAQ